MKTFFLLALVAASFAVDINQIFTSHQQQSMAQVRESKMGAWILDFAELHLQTQGYLEELVHAIEEVIVDLEKELDETHAVFNRRTGNHNKEVAKLTQFIEDAQREIFNGVDFSDNVLTPQRDRITATLRQLKQNIGANRQSLASETKTRKNDKEAFEARIADHNEAIAAIDECLELLSTITNPSLVQIKKIQGHIQNLHNKLKSHSTFAPIIRALLQMATEQNFANQDTLKEIVVNFNLLRVNLVDQVNQETSEEAVFAADFVARVAQLEKEHIEFQRLVMLRNAELTRTNGIIIFINLSRTYG